MMHTSLLIPFIQPVNKAKNKPRIASRGPCTLPRGCPAGCRWGLGAWEGGGAVITPAGNQRPAELKDPRPHGALTGRPTVKRHAAHGDAGPGPQFPAKPLLIEVQPPVGPSQRGRGKRSVLNNYYVTEVSLTTQDFFLFFWWGWFSHELKLNFLRMEVLFSHFSQSTKRGPKGDIWPVSKGWPTMEVCRNNKTL